MAGPSLPADFAFEPKVWEDHINAYRDRKLSYGAFAFKPSEKLVNPGTGNTVNFPYFKAIGDAEEPGADEALTVDKLEDDSFSATIKEIGKAVGIRRAAIRKSAASRERIFAEAQEQMGRVHAEKIDKDLITEIATAYTQGYTSADASEANRGRIENVLEGKVVAFGDKHTDAVVMFAHSLVVLDIMTYSGTGFMKADANDPLFRVPGFQGRLAGMAVVEVDTVPQVTSIGGKKTFDCFVCKPNAFGFMDAEEMDMGADYDMLHREYLFASTQWYAVKNFHGKVDALDRRIAKLTFATRANG